MRVLTVGNMYPPHHFGGYELVWRAAVEHLRATGHDVRVLTTDVDTGTTEPDDDDVHRDLRWHLREGRFDPVGPVQALRLARHNHAVLSRHLDEQRPDVVGWWSMGGLTLTMLESVRRRRLPAVAFVHDDWLDYGPRVDPWTRMFAGPRRGRLAPLAGALAGIPSTVDLASTGSYVFVSEFTRRRALDRRPDLDPGRTWVAHSGVHPDFLEAAPEHDWAWRLLYVGRLDPRKGIDTAVQALSELPPEARLTIVGGWDDRERARLEQLAQARGVGEQVIFAGQCDRAGLLAAYSSCDAVVFPVRWDEPWGLVPLEAMGRGRPVVATGRGGSGEYLRHERNCLLFDAEDPGDLARALHRLANEPELRSHLRATGLTTAPLHTEAVLNTAVEEALTGVAA